MGFSFRGKTSERPVVVSETEGVATGSDSHNPEVDLKKFRKLHTFDPYLDVDKLEAVDNVLATGDIEKEAVIEDQLLTEDSPYPEVRASVSNSPVARNMEAHSSQYMNCTCNSRIPPFKKALVLTRS